MGISTLLTTPWGGKIVEMGAGTGYWGRLLQLRGVDIICYDLHVADDDGDEARDESNEEDKEEEDEEVEEGSEEEEEQHDSDDEEEGDGEEEDEGSDEEEVEVEQIYWMDVLKGTPKDLRKHTDRTLFLCYPDDFEDSSESMALQALHNYSGEYVIHVGELFGQTLCLPGAWGRTSSSEFQVHLASVYHKILQVPLPSWHSSLDSLTVWKRTKTSIMDNSFYAFIPENERLDLVTACASTRHLLDDPSSESPQAATPAKRKAPRSQDKQTPKKAAYGTDETSGNANKTKKKHRNRKHRKKSSTA
jgi:hypothetical protein